MARHVGLPQALPKPTEPHCGRATSDSGDERDLAMPLRIDSQGPDKWLRDLSPIRCRVGRGKRIIGRRR
jgi:hypothetical protein